MKKLIFFLLLISITTSITSQTWAPSGATWNFSFNEMFSFGYVKIEYVKDTIIQSKCSKILKKTQYGYSYPGVYDTINSGKEYTYLDSVKNIIYRYFNNHFDTLYNFNAKIGDTWKVHGMHGFRDSGIVKVSNIGYDTINSVILKSIFVQTISGCVGWYSAKIIERIGCINDYMFPNFISCVADVGEGGPFRCYSDNNFELYSTGEAKTCDYITGINNINKSAGFKICPNPATSYINIVHSPQTTVNSQNSSEKYVLTLRNMEGQEVKKLRMENGELRTIDVRNLRSGIYFLTMQNDKESYVRKVVIEK